MVQLKRRRSVNDSDSENVCVELCVLRMCVMCMCGMYKCVVWYMCKGVCVYVVYVYL